MTQLIWGILNVGIFIYFIIICAKSTGFIREKLGIFPTIVYGFGLLSFIAYQNNEDPKVTTIDFQNSNKNQSRFIGNTYLQSIDLEDNLSTTTQLDIKFIEKEEGLKPLNGQIIKSGFIFGNNWKTHSISIEKSELKNNYKYNVSGIIEWHLLGFKLFSENKKFQGLFELRK